MAPEVKHPTVAGPNDPTKQVSKTVYEQAHTLTDVASAATQSSHASDATDPHSAAGYVKETDANYVDLTDGGATTLHSHAGSSGASWTQVINESGASFANWTGVSGTWASDGTSINQTDTSAATHLAKYNTKVEHGYGLIYELEFRYPTTGQGSSPRQAAMVLGFDGTNNNNNLVVKPYQSFAQIEVEADNVAIFRDFQSVTITLDVWYKLRAVMVGPWMSVYRDGVLLGTTNITNQNITVRGGADFLGLMSYSSLINFRNIKAWVLTGGAPA